MKIHTSRFAGIALAALLLAGCAAPPAGSRNPRTFALILSGDIVSYSTPGLGARISVVDVDGKRAIEPQGPLELPPGRHTITLACDGTTKAHSLVMAAGEVYQFVARATPGAKGCTGALSRVRTTNP